MMIEIKMNY